MLEVEDFPLGRIFYFKTSPLPVLTFADVRSAFYVSSTTTVVEPLPQGSEPAVLPLPLPSIPIPPDRAIATKRLFLYVERAQRWVERLDIENLPESDTEITKVRLADRTPPTTPPASLSARRGSKENLVVFKLRTVLRFLKEKGAKRVYVFGSAITSEATAHDWDFGAEGWLRQPTHDDLYAWQEELTDHLGKAVNIVNFDKFFDKVRQMRAEAYRITEDGSTTAPPKAYLQFRQTTETTYLEMEHLSQKLHSLNRDRADSYGVAKRLESFYTRLEQGFWKRVLQAYKVTLPTGASSHSDYIRLFSPESPQPSLPTMPSSLVSIVDDLKRFTQFARVGYVEDYYMDALWSKVENLPQILTYVTSSIYSSSDSHFFPSSSGSINPI